jgi:cytochrome c oxidase assembly factor CtaG
MVVLAVELALVAGGVMQSEVGLLAALDLVGLALSVVISRRSGQGWPLAVMGAQLTAVACLLLYRQGDGRPVAAWLAAHVTGLVMLAPVLLVRFWAPRKRLVTEP